MSKKDKLAFISSKNELIIKEKFKYTPTQLDILKCGTDRNTRCLILDGVPGVSKTYLAILIALRLLKEHKIRNISYIRSLIQAQDGNTGYLSGTLEEKTQYYNIPLFDKLEELLIRPDIERLFKEEIIKTFPTSMLRGYQLNGATILDETQNMLFSSIETVLTRMAEHSLLIVCGDSSGFQNDLGAKSGFKHFCEIFNDLESRDNGIFYFKLDSSQIVRSKFVKFIIEKLQKIKH